MRVNYDLKIPIAALQNYKKGWYLWTHYWRWVWALILLAGLNFSYRDAISVLETPFALQSIHRPIITMFLVFFLIPWIVRHPSVLFKGIAGILISFSLWRLTSALWSLRPEWTLYRAIEYISVIVAIIYIATSAKKISDIRRWVNNTWTFLGLLTLSAWCGIIFFPKQALIYLPGATLPFMLNGVIPRINPNALAHLGGLLSLVALERFFSSKASYKWVLLFLWGLGTLIFAQGRGAFLGFLVGMTFILFSHRKNVSSMLLLIFIIVIVLTVIWIYPDIFWGFVFRGQSLETVANWSGRLNWWYKICQVITLKTLFVGYGGFAGARIIIPVTLGISHRITTDNTWLELLVNVGLVGDLLFAIVIVWTMKTLYYYVTHGRGEMRSLSVELSAILLMALVRSIFVASLIWHNAFFVLVPIGTAIYLQQKHERV